MKITCLIRGIIEIIPVGSYASFLEIVQQLIYLFILRLCEIVAHVFFQPVVQTMRVLWQCFFLKSTNFFFSKAVPVSSCRMASMANFFIVSSAMPNHPMNCLSFKESFLPMTYEALKPQLKQWKLSVPSADVIIPPRFLLSAPVPLCTQQGALKEVQPDGFSFDQPEANSE